MEVSYQDIIKKRIKEKFKTIENFSKHMNIPRTTLNFILKNGVGVSGFDMVNRILSELDIPIASAIDPNTDERSLDLLKTFDSLDEAGKHTLETIASTELERIYNPHSSASIAAYGGTLNSSVSDEEKEILELVRKIKTEL